MELAELSRAIKKYRTFTKMNKSLFAKLIGANVKALSRLEDGKFILMETRRPFIAALQNKTLKPGMIPLASNGRQLKGCTASIAAVELILAPPFSIELTQVIETAERYLTLILVWGKTTGRQTAASRMRVLMTSLIAALKQPKSGVPMQRHCMLMGMIQGFMIKEGVVTIEEILDDQNTLYYADPLTVKGAKHEQAALSRKTG